jgi:hypothetical protein
VEFYGKITSPFWNDRPVAIVAGGTSLIGFDFERLRGAHVLAVKGTIFDIPWADAGFGLDMPRYMDWRDKLANVQSRVYWAVPVEQLDKTGPPPSSNVTFLRRLEGEGISESPGEIYGGGTSGYGALQIALHKRAKEIGLFGFDYNPDTAVGHMVSGAPMRHNDQHYKRKMAQSAANWLEWSKHFDSYLPYLSDNNIRVINACQNSGITCFPTMPLEDGVEFVRGNGGL